MPNSIQQLTQEVEYSEEFDTFQILQQNMGPRKTNKKHKLQSKARSCSACVLFQTRDLAIILQQDTSPGLELIRAEEWIGPLLPVSV